MNENGPDTTEIFSSPLVLENIEDVLKSPEVEPTSKKRVRSFELPKPNPKIQAFQADNDISQDQKPVVSKPEEGESVETYGQYRAKRPGLPPSYYNLNTDFPDDLKKLFSALICELCNVKTNSVLSARAHYESKQHERKVGIWLTTNVPDYQYEPPSKKDKVTSNALRCEICDLALTSIQHAKMHYEGRKHKRAVEGTAAPSGSGYFNKDTGKWVRT